MVNNILDFKKLPADIQAKLIELQTPAENRYAFIPRLPVYLWLAIAAGIIWCIYLFASTQNYIWEFWMFWLLAAGSIIFISLALFAAYQIITAKTAKLKDGFVFTKDECIGTKGGRVEFWSLKELEGFQFREDIKTIEIWIGERLKKIKADNVDDARKLEEQFVDWRNEAAEESFLKPFAKNELAPNNSARYAAVAGGIIVLLGISSGIIYAAKIINRNHDDEKIWRLVENGKTIADFDQYKQRHPNGNYISQADRKISDILGSLKTEYIGKVKKSADEKAINALSEVLENAGKLPNRTIFIKVGEKLELDDEVVKVLRRQTGVSVNTYDYSIPPRDTPFRKDMLSKEIGLAFLPATRNASINFELNDNPPADSTVIDVNYVVRSTETVYQFSWYSNGSMTTFYNPATRIEFDLVFKTAEKELYKTNYISLFTKPQNPGLIDSRDAVNYSFDKLYFSSVSKDFAKYLERQFGFTE